MQAIWKQYYPEGVLAEININECASIAELFHQNIEKYRDRPAYSNMGKTLSYNDLDLLTRNFSAYLSSELGLQKGDRIAIMMPNILQYPVVLFAALRAGLVVA